MSLKYQITSEVSNSVLREFKLCSSLRHSPLVKLQPWCLVRQICSPWEKKKILERASGSQWVRGIVKESQPARPRGRKEAIKVPQVVWVLGTSWLLSHQHILGDGKKKKSARQKIREMSRVDLSTAPRRGHLQKGVGYQDRRLPTASWLYPGGPGRAL